MSFLNPMFLYALPLIIVPVIIHLMFRAKPKRRLFPALRLLQQRRLPNVRRMRLRKIWLLLLRMILLTGVILFLARPTLPAAQYTPNPREWGSILLVIVASGISYWAGARYYQRRYTSRTEFLYKRTWLRAVLGMLTLVLFLLLFVLPYSQRIMAEIQGPVPTGVENIPVTAVILCDTSPSMNYQQQGETRWEVARRLMIEQIRRFPVGSRIAIIDINQDMKDAVFSSDLAAAINRLETLQTYDTTHPLDLALLHALRLHREDVQRQAVDSPTHSTLADRDLFLREIYILTDLTRSAWQYQAPQAVREALEAQPDVSLYILDAGTEAPVNVGLRRIRFSQPHLTSQGAVEIIVDAIQVGDRHQHPVELWLLDQKGRWSKQDHHLLPADQAETEIRFVLKNSDTPWVQGDVRLVASDPLMTDNQVHFTVPMIDSLQIVVISENRQQANYIINALEGLNQVHAGYTIQWQAATNWKDVSWFHTDLVCVVHWDSPSPEAWMTIQHYVQQGGGVFWCLGAPSRIGQGTGLDPLAYNHQAAQTCFPCVLSALTTFPQPQQMIFKKVPFSLEQRLDKFGVLKELQTVDFYKYWKVTPDPTASVWACWNDESSSPALILRPRGSGRVLVFASSLESVSWNELPRSWSLLLLLRELISQLTLRGRDEYTLSVGESASLSWIRSPQEREVLLSHPNLTQELIQLGQDQRTMEFPALRLRGHYVAVERQSRAPVLAFSANISPEESDLSRLTTAELDALLGPKRYSVARSGQELERTIHAQRLGIEVGWLLLLIVAVIIVIEQLTATWFYRDEANTRYDTEKSLVLISGD